MFGRHDPIVMNSDKYDHHHAGFLVWITPGVAGAVLDDCVARAELASCAVIQFKHAASRNNELIINSRGRVHSGVVGLEVVADSGKPFIQFTDSRIHIEIFKH